MNDSPENLPVMQEPIDHPFKERAEISVPVLIESVDQDELQRQLFEGSDLPATPPSHGQLPEQISHLLAQKINELLPAIMQEAEQQIATTLQQQITEQLPEIINDALKASRQDLAVSLADRRDDQRR
ncbi:hypothetical protein MNBD_GAMMA18-1811 [hydrothermal vent metagenome]|uniref:Uncharacterized protein n=1 Tax=hydrothermal vent metagenome TaxID=652676 RepID=A0A3B0ZXX3_9ZZZZ